MISFDEKGNPLPIGINPLSIDEFALTFLFSTTREEIYVNYMRYISDIQKDLMREFTNWIGGSFTTKKEKPSDIDLVNLFNYSTDLNSKHTVLMRFLTLGGSKLTYKVDGYFIPVYPATDPRYAITEFWLNHWKNFFGQDRFNNPKGIIEISVN